MLILLPWVVLGCFIANWLFSKVGRKPKRLIYTLDVTLRLPYESYDDFIKRAFSQGLGRYIVEQ
jgi:hypothetical protein